MTTSTLVPANLLRRLSSLIIDVLVIAIILSIATVLFLVCIKILVLVNMYSTEYEGGLRQLFSSHPDTRSAFIAYTAIIWIGFFTYYWVHHSQTPGMKCLHLMVRTPDNKPITYTQALVRLFTSCFGLSNLLCLIDPQTRAFQDIWAGTQVFLLSTDKKK